MSQLFKSKFWFAIIASFALMACSNGMGQPTLDLSNEESFETSIREVMESLDEEQQGEFSDALSMIMFDEVANGAAAGRTEAEMEKAIYDRLHGKTAQQVIDDMQENL